VDNQSLQPRVRSAIFQHHDYDNRCLRADEPIHHDALAFEKFMVMEWSQFDSQTLTTFRD